ncbi:hypothetical protein GCM10023085_53970 [Actinomadura viridis]
MYEERLAEFSRERLDGRPIPDDLRTMLVAQWEGRTDFQSLLDVTFFEPGRLSPLLGLTTRTSRTSASPSPSWPTGSPDSACHSAAATTTPSTSLTSRWLQKTHG